MSKREQIVSYVNDPSRKVCGEMAIAFGQRDIKYREKLVFKSYDEAVKKSQQYNMQKIQTPYLCQFCQYWHLGKNMFNNLSGRTFLIPSKKKHVYRDEIRPDRPLMTELNKIEFEVFRPIAVEEFKIDKLLSINKIDGVYSQRLQFFFLSPKYKAIAWALHMPKNGQPLILKVGRNFIFRGRSGDYWDESLDL